MTEDEEHWRRIERMYLSAPINEYYKSDIEVGDGTARIVMSVNPEWFHSAAMLHGSVFFKMLDDAAVFAAYSLEHHVAIPTTSFTIHLLGSVETGVLEATATVVGRSRRVYLAEAELRCEGELVAHGSGMFTRSRVPLDSMAGYAGPLDA